MTPPGPPRAGGVRASPVSCSAHPVLDPARGDRAPSRWQMWEAVWDRITRSPLSPQARLVALVIARHFVWATRIREEVAFVSLREIAEESGLTRRSVQRLVKQIDASGVLVVRFAGSGRDRSSYGMGPDPRKTRVRRPSKRARR